MAIAFVKVRVNFVKLLQLYVYLKVVLYLSKS